MNENFAVLSLTRENGSKQFTTVNVVQKSYSYEGDAYYWNGVQHLNFPTEQAAQKMIDSYLANGFVREV